LFCEEKNLERLIINACQQLVMCLKLNPLDWQEVHI